MKNKNKMIILLSNTKEFIKKNKWLFQFIIIGLFLLSITLIAENNKIDNVKKEILEKTNIEILVEKQSENLKVIWKNLEDQKDIRKDINVLEKKLDGKIDQVKSLEQENSESRKEMLEDANDITVKKN